MKILIAEVGSQGDLNPFLALALALRRCGIEPVMAVPNDHVRKCRMAGLDAVAIGPSIEEVAAQFGMDEGAFYRKLSEDPFFMVGEVLLKQEIAHMDKIVDLAFGCDAVAAAPNLISAAIASEVIGKPYFEVILQPYHLISRWAPPLWRKGPPFVRPPATKIGAAWNRAMLAGAGLEFRRRFGALLNKARRMVDLPRTTRTPVLQSARKPERAFALFSKHLYPPQPDWPDDLVQCGFTFLDSETGAKASLAPEIDAFLKAGPPPIVFTLGTTATKMNPGFFEVSAAAARRLKTRALLLTGDDREIREEGIQSARYAPHSLVFPRAAVVVTHGGIGSVGQAMRSGKPHLVVEHFMDQLDNGMRVEQSGTGLLLRETEYDPDRAVAALRDLMEDSARATRARSVGRDIRNSPDGADVAAQAMARALGGRRAEGTRAALAS